MRLPTTGWQHRCDQGKDHDVGGQDRDRLCGEVIFSFEPRRCIVSALVGGPELVIQFAIVGALGVKRDVAAAHLFVL